MSGSIRSINGSTVSWILGPLLLGTAIAHLIVGIALFQEPLADMMRSGIINSIEFSVDTRAGAWRPVHPQSDREAAFLFLMLTPVLVLLAQVLRHATAHRDTPLITTIGWYLVGLGVLGVAVMPLSGFWILIALGLLSFRAASELGVRPQMGDASGSSPAPPSLAD